MSDLVDCGIWYLCKLGQVEKIKVKDKLTNRVINENEGILVLLLI